MNSQLSAIIAEFESAKQRLDHLADHLTDSQWTGTVDPTRWSPVQCIQHLNLTSRAFLPLIRDGLETARRQGGEPPARYRFDFAGWIIWRSSGPRRGFGRIRTTPPFIPVGDLSRALVLDEFARLQQEQIQLVRESEGLPLGKVKIVSPFNRRLRYNLFSALSILPHHQHRHIQQAERSVRMMAGNA